MMNTAKSALHQQRSKNSEGNSQVNSKGDSKGVQKGDSKGTSQQKEDLKEDLEDEFQLHPQITKMLDILSEDGRVYVLREDDLQNVFIKLLKMQRIIIEQQSEFKKDFETVKKDLATRQSELLELKESITKLPQSQVQRQGGAIDLLKKIDNAVTKDKNSVTTENPITKDKIESTSKTTALIRTSAINRANANISAKLASSQSSNQSSNQTTTQPTTQPTTATQTTTQTRSKTSMQSTIAATGLVTQSTQATQGSASNIPNGRRRIAKAPATSPEAASPLANRIHNGKLSLRKGPALEKPEKLEKQDRMSRSAANFGNSGGFGGSGNRPNIGANPRAGGGSFNAAYTQSESQHNTSREKNKKGVNTRNPKTPDPFDNIKTVTNPSTNANQRRSTRKSNAEDELEKLLSSYDDESKNPNQQVVGKGMKLSVRSKNSASASDANTIAGNEEIADRLDGPDGEGIENADEVDNDLVGNEGTEGKVGMEEQSEIDPEDVVNFFDCVYILNLSNNGQNLQEKLEKFGFKNIEILQPKQNMGLVDNLADIVIKAKKEDMKTIMILKDNVLVYNNLIQELGHQLSNMDENARVLYLGAALMKTKDAVNFDPNFYLETYTDLVEQGIDDEEKAFTHWKTKGSREGRWGSRSMNHPDLVKDLSAIVLHMDVFDLLIKNLANVKKGKGSDSRGFDKLVSNYCYALTPPPFMNEITKYNKNKNSTNNAHLYL